MKYSEKRSGAPLFLKGTFKATQNTDTFLDMRGFTNAIVYVNGFNLGRFLKRGPQYTLYLPGTLLKDENEIVVLELEGTKKKSVSLVDKAIFNC